MFIDAKHPDKAAIKERQKQLEGACKNLQELAEARLEKLKVSLNCYLTLRYKIYCCQLFIIKIVVGISNLV